jgi:hypothetical protein
MKRAAGISCMTFTCPKICLTCTIMLMMILTNASLQGSSIYSSNLCEKKYEALGTDKWRKSGKCTGRRAINENVTEEIPDNEGSIESNDEKASDEVDA